MIILLAGENDFMRTQTLAALVGSFDGEAERYDGDRLDAAALGDIFTGQTLFSDKRLVVIKQLSDNKPLWEMLPERLESVSGDTTVVFVEPKPDKRSRAYKALQKVATVKDFPVWTQRDTPAAVKWINGYAKSRGVSLTDKQARLLVSRVGVDQWQLHHAVEKLALVEEITEEHIIELTDARPDDNVFALLETALAGDKQELGRMIEALKRSEDAYRVFGLLSSQLLQLTALALRGDRTPAEVAGEIGAPPFVLAKLAPFAARLGRREARRLIERTADTDAQMKSTAVDPWLIISAFLLENSPLGGGL